jgi:hypothetical protein
VVVLEESFHQLGDGSMAWVGERLLGLDELSELVVELPVPGLIVGRLSAREGMLGSVVGWSPGVPILEPVAGSFPVAQVLEAGLEYLAWREVAAQFEMNWREK